MKLLIPDMTCGHCEKHIRQAISSIDSDAKVTVDLEAKEVEVVSTAEPQALVRAIEAEGYTPSIQAA